MDTTGPQGSGTGSVLGGEAAPMPLMNSDSDGLWTSVDAMELSSSPVMTASPPNHLLESVCAATNGGLHPAYGDMVPQRDSTQSGDSTQLRDSTQSGDSMLTDTSHLFAEQVGPTSPLAPDATAADFFMQFFNENLLDHIVRQTNLYAEQNPPSDRYRWYDVCLSELKAFLGVIIGMGIKRPPAIFDYWSSHPILGTPELVKGFPLNRFKHLLSHLHFNDNTTALPREDPAHDKLHKIRPVLDAMVDKCLKLYAPHQENFIHEAMVGFKGRSALKQYMPLKPTKRGFKIIMVPIRL